MVKVSTSFVFMLLSKVFEDAIKTPIIKPYPLMFSW